MTAHIETAELHGQPVLKLQTPDGAVALISLFGAQVLSWVPAGGEDRLYLSPDAVFDGATPKAWQRSIWWIRRKAWPAAVSPPPAHASRSNRSMA